MGFRHLTTTDRIRIETLFKLRYSTRTISAELKIHHSTIAMTEMACADPTLMLLDTRYFAALNEVTSMSLDGTTLTLANTDGTAVVVYLER